VPYRSGEDWEPDIEDWFDDWRVPQGSAGAAVLLFAAAQGLAVRVTGEGEATTLQGEVPTSRGELYTSSYEASVVDLNLQKEPRDTSTISGEILFVTETINGIYVAVAGARRAHGYKPEAMRDILQSQGLTTAAELNGRQVTLNQQTGEISFEEREGPVD